MAALLPNADRLAQSYASVEGIHQTYISPITWLAFELGIHCLQSKLQMLQQKAGVNSKTTTANLTLSLAAQAEAAEFGGDQPDDATHGLNVGLLAYPVLQAADILIYRATEVPIGEDQIQHLELTNMIARSFNSTYGKEVFPISKGIYASTESKRIMSLRVPTSKMSKSDPSDASRINMDDPPDVIRSKIRKATVDSTRGITYDPIQRPGVANLINIYSSCTGEPVEEVTQRFAGSGNKEFKDAVADAVIDGVKPIQSEYGRIRKDPQFVEQALETGEARARSLGSKTLNDVQRAMGLR
ncbi:Tryptophan--tRNA ligase, mitochondrial [Gaertneriomyces sp. JEL0708]|nr:Tryptophan--tRNA ligase, mitochondrial [Gaertneriomyces sp. JEL0708]